ncbi:uncharacterized protein LOC108036413 [Drosophila biarmipes]|uniref:uncharacterized protein LOC108036413 n=1 Tax=Drosophila biarmipes TaxID=125945 RepID=UPI0007E87B42|nr:uncharacterized protein LOC108036413 [Drosophila biarmipes]
MNEVYNKIQSNEFSTPNSDTNINTDRFAFEEPAAMLPIKDTSKASEEPRVLRRSQRIKDKMEKKKIKAMMSYLQNTKDPLKSKTSRSTRRVTTTKRKCKSVKLVPKYFECVSINGRLYRLKDLTDAMKKVSIMQRLQHKPPKKNLGTARPLKPGRPKKTTNNSMVLDPLEADENTLGTTRARRPGRPKKKRNNSMVGDLEESDEKKEMAEKNANLNRKRYGQRDTLKDVEYKPPRSYRVGKSQKDSTATNEKPELRRSERIKNQKERLLALPEKAELENLGKRRPESSRPNKQDTKLNEISGNMAVGIAIQKKQQKQKRQNRRKILGTAGRPQLGKSKKNSGNNKAEDSQDVVPTLRDSKVVDWKKIGIQKVVHEPPIVLRSSARIAEIKRRKELESNLKKSEEESKPRKVPKPRTQEPPENLGLLTCFKCKNPIVPKPFSTTYMECAEINGRLYKLGDLSEDMSVGCSFRKKQKKSQQQKSRRLLGTKGPSRAAEIEKPLPKDLKRLNGKHR